ncbi:MAG: ABC transporter ATP-binding protein [Halothiobacillus sp.]
MIRCDQLCGGYRGKAVFGPIDLTFEAGSVVALLGGNGSGKTTLLKTILGLRPPLSGVVYWQNKPLHTLSLAERARLVAFVPQQHKVTFGLRVRDIVAMGSKAGLIKATSAEALARADAALAQLKQSHLAEKRITELSGGQQQLILIARALAQQTPVLVLDEPVNHLDWGHQQRLLDLIVQLAATERTIIFSTHHPDHAKRVAHRCVLMRAGQVLADGACVQKLTSDALNDLYQLDF